jgi:AcrR family transcriptional regulator
MGIAERKEREKEQRRVAIIDAAEAVFFTRGFDNATMDDIAGQAELSKGTIYLYFQSKDELHFEIMERGNQILLGHMERRMDPGLPGRQNLRILGEAFVEFSNLHPDYFKAMMSFQSRDVEQQKINEQKLKNFIEGRSSVSLLKAIVIKGITDGSVRSDMDPVHLTTLLWSQILGILVMYATKKPVFEFQQISREELVSIHLDVISAGLKPVGPREIKKTTKKQEGHSHA